MADCKELKLDFTLKDLTLSSQSEDVPGSSSTVALRSNKFVCVEYPAVVTNVDKMLETLGGEENLSKVGMHDRDIHCNIPKVPETASVSFGIKPRRLHIQYDREEDLYGVLNDFTTY